jgi:hypothetical protein
MDSQESQESQKEFNPTSPEDRSDLTAYNGWLKDGKARLDATATQGNLATNLVVEDEKMGGHWEIPLLGGIQVVDQNDLHFMTGVPADINIQSSDSPTNDGQTPSDVIKVSYHATDDETRKAEVDTSKEPVFVHNQ